jgi:hypothetical protein
MKLFRAELASYRLPLVVPALCDGKPLTGALRLERGATRRVFHFQHGALVRAISNEPREHLAQVLASLGILEVTRAAAAFEAARGVQAPLGTFLVDRGFVDKGRLQEAMAHKARESFFDCYAWECGELELTAEAPPDDGGVALSIPLGTLHRDGLARLREWRAFRDIFPDSDSTFRVHRQVAVEWRTEEEDRLLALAERGASLGELLAVAPEGQLFSARRLLQLYRRGVLSPRAPAGTKVGEAPDVERLMSLVRMLLSEGRFETAAEVAAQTLERAPVPEACALYREAEVQMALAVGDHLLSLEGRLQFAPLPRPTPPELTADDLYLYSLMRSSRSVRQALQQAAMGELPAWRTVRRLAKLGLIQVTPAPGGSGHSDAESLAALA